MTRVRDALDSLELNRPSSLMYRRARALAYFIEGTQLIVYNFLSNRSFTCGFRCFELLAKSDEWTPLHKIFEISDDEYTKSLVEEFIKLFSLTALVVQGDHVAELDEEYERTWEWGNVTGLLHFSAKDNPTIPDRLSIDAQIARASGNPSPKLFSSTSSKPENISLPPFQVTSSLHAVMRARRTIRAFKDEPIPLLGLSDILFSGLGITDIVQTPVGDHPLKMTPSPGARNPYEAYVFSNKVEGLLTEKFYHYCAFDHTLSLAPTSLARLPSMTEMLAGNQPWVESAGAIIILVAHFERVMWKYPNGNAYLSVLIEAGHIGQNMMLSATEHGLVANPSGAISQSLIERALGLEKISQSVVYVLALGVPDYSADYVKWLVPEFRERHNLMGVDH